MEGFKEDTQKNDWNKEMAEELISIFMDCLQNVFNVFKINLDREVKNEILEDIKMICEKIVEGYQKKELGKMKAAINKLLKLSLYTKRLQEEFRDG